MIALVGISFPNSPQFREIYIHLSEFKSTIQLLATTKQKEVPLTRVLKKWSIFLKAFLKFQAKMK